MKFAFVFPGQGSQSVGMGKELAEQYPAAKEVFDAVNDALNQDLSKIIWEGPAEDLTLTENTQPALMAVSMAVMAVLEAEYGIGIQAASHVAGHSLGEYTALAASNAIGLADTARLLKRRGQAMQRAVPVGEGAMVALLGATEEQAMALCIAGKPQGVIAIANDNAPGQIVLSGAKAAIDEAVKLAKDIGVKRAILLPVSAPFHCPLMQPAADEMEEALSQVQIKTPAVPLVANITAEPSINPQAIRRQLVEQVTGRVRWRESIECLVGADVTNFAEIGAGKVLSTMVRRISDKATGFALNDPDSIAAFAKKLKQETE
ncbi:Malonyl CoA-acyl carrier protein transacylase [hydrothermal vent metagenome]|uniref:[acyl-carrier-protein] S-malonyltransferase n=1 Tax=hydrothermal vent metagenome TaxID=652676 RepID=A0A3B0S8Z4_9ZZZZ